MNGDKEIQTIHRIAKKIKRPIRIMEVCGTHTMAAFRSGLRSLLPENVILISGPGCPVCVTPNEYLDKVIAISQKQKTIITTFGDMIRVPGTECSLEYARAKGAKISLVYSPVEAMEIAKKNPHHSIVFLGIGFETTAPTIAWTIYETFQKGIDNFYVLSGLKTMPHALSKLAEGEVLVDGFLCPGHVGVIIGAQAFDFICHQYSIPCVIAGFETSDMIQGIAMLLHQIVENRNNVEIQYSRCVSKTGNQIAQNWINTVFEECDSQWRGMGVIPLSGLSIKQKFQSLDADAVFSDYSLPINKVNPHCLCGKVLQGIHTPNDCKLFRKECTPDTPIGPCMVSAEGTCAAYYKYY